MKLINFFLPVVFIVSLFSCKNETKSNDENQYIVAAYVWPSCPDERLIRETLWAEGIGEWEIIQKGNPRFDGH